MDSPIEASDLVSLAHTAYNISRYLQEAPNDLKVLLEKFDDIGKRLESLDHVLVSSGWGPYDKIADLRDIFEEGKAVLIRHTEFPDQSGSEASRWSKSTRFNEDEIQQFEKRVGEQAKMVKEFKTNVMFLASVRNLQSSRTNLQGQRSRAFQPNSGTSNLLSAGIAPTGRSQQLGEEARTTSDMISVISEAITALQFATKLNQRTVTLFDSSLESIIASSPEVIALPSSADRELMESFIIHTEQLVEKLQLYTNEAAPEKHFEQLSLLVAKAETLTRDLRPSKAGMSAEVRSLHLPTIAPSPHSFSSSFLANPEFQRWASSSTDLNWPVPTQGQTSPVLGRPARSITQSTSTQTDGDAIFSMRSLSFSEVVEVGGPAKEHVSLSGWVRIYAGKQTDSQKISCKLDIAFSEGSICLWAVATSRRRPSSTIEAVTMPAAMTPGKLMHGHQMDIASDSEGSLRTFQHSFTNINRPVPHILHPSVEGPDIGENYSIIFHDPQYFVEEGCPPKWTRELKYIFANEIDRNIVRSKIFGKILLRSAGTEKITFNYIACLQHAITLWEDEKTHIRTITFYRDPPNNKSHSPGDVEYKILGITDLKRAEKDGEPLPLNVKQISQDPSPVSATSRRSSVLSSSSTKSSKPRSRDDMSCFIHFSESRDKKAFVQILRQRAPG